MRKNKKFIHRFLERNIINMNGCKYLSSSESRKYYLFFRDRKEDQSYFLITLKGNYIRAYKNRYLDSNGNGINTYMKLFIPALIGGKESIEEMPIHVKKLIVKKELGDYKNFVREFKDLTPSLVWFDDEDIK